MATQVVGLNAPTSLATPTLRVFADGSDTQVSGSPFTLVEATNRKGYYEVSFTGTLAGLHQCILYTGLSPIGWGWVTLANASATYVVASDRGVNVSWENQVSTSSVTTINANIGTTAPNTAQTGDNFARIGVAGVGLTNLGDTRIANLDATVSSRMATYTQPTGFLTATFPGGTITNNTATPSWYSAPGTAPTASQNATAVWTDLLSGSDFSTAASIGKLLKDDVDATISSRSTYAGGAVASVTGNVGGNVLGTVATVNALAANSVNASALATDAVTEIWSAGTRTLTSGSGLTVDANVVTIDGQSVVASAEVNFDVLVLLDVAVSSRLATVNYTEPPTAAQNADTLLLRDAAGGAVASSNGHKSVAYYLQGGLPNFNMSVSPGVILGSDGTTTVCTLTFVASSVNPIVSGVPA